MSPTHDSTTQIAEAIDRPDIEDAAYIGEIQVQMLRFAEQQLSDVHLAEDAVQEALIGAMKNADSFKGKSAFKTWVFAILKNKIADIIRKRKRTVEITNLITDDENEQGMDYLFDQKGQWSAGGEPQSWGDPEQSFKEDQFWDVLDTCLNELPAKQSKIFMMREFIGLSTDEICNQESLSVSNLHVILYRARLRLQKCLEIRWFNGEKNA
ncbi:MAG: RNA polymerase sigma-70 factor (ECF subfamily) [Flavobacteriales bacterium]|jgi:RNA polymerase sigma-70 factor (ECF subfamily)